jgi:hypothetical protein
LRLPRARRGSRAPAPAAAGAELSDGNEARLVYSDDPRLRGSGLFGLWLERAELGDAQRRARLTAEIENAVDERPGSPTAAGDTRKLRGIPAIGRGVAGAMNGTDPLREALKKERRAADRDDR